MRKKHVPKPTKLTKYNIQDTRPGQLPEGIYWGAYLLFCNPKPLRTEALN
jgi:hypothetical protein